MADFSKAIALDPNDSASYNDRGTIYRRTGNFQAAVADFTKAIELDPKEAGTYYNRAFAFKKLGRVQDAIADLERCIELSADPHWHGRAQTFLQELRGE